MTDLLSQLPPAPDYLREGGINAADLMLGLGLPMAVVGYRGKVWRMKFKGNETIVLNEDSKPAQDVTVVVVGMNSALSKIYYEGGYQEGSSDPPDCFSHDGIRPDASVAQPVNDICGTCPKNRWGSEISKVSGKGVKACRDSRRVAIVPEADMRNEDYGGAMLLRIPPDSLAQLGERGDQLTKLGYPLNGVAMRISFDVEAAYPRLVFDVARVLEPEEFAIAKEIAEDQQTDIVLHGGMSTAIEHSEPRTIEHEVQQPQPQPRPVVALPPVAAKQQPKPVAARTVQAPQQPAIPLQSLAGLAPPAAPRVAAAKPVTGAARALVGAPTAKRGLGAAPATPNALQPTPTVINGEAEEAGEEAGVQNTLDMSGMTEDQKAAFNAWYAQGGAGKK